MVAFWKRLFHVWADTPGFEYILIDNTISKAHADATGAKGENCRYRQLARELITKLHAVVDALGLPLRIHPAPRWLGIPLRYKHLSV